MQSSIVFWGTVGVLIAVLIVQHRRLRYWREEAHLAEERWLRAAEGRNKWMNLLFAVYRQKDGGETGGWHKDPDWWRKL